MTMSRRIDWLRGQVKSTQRREAIPGLAVAVGPAGDPPLVVNAGWADVDLGVPVTDSTQFRIGSITKTFTAAVILGLAERGVLDLDERAHGDIPAQFGSHGLSMMKPQGTLSVSFPPITASRFFQCSLFITILFSRERLTGAQNRFQF